MPISVAIVGSGPSGFYTAEALAKAAGPIDAKGAAQRLGELVAVHVIPRPHEDLEAIFPIQLSADSGAK